MEDCGDGAGLKHTCAFFARLNYIGRETTDRFYRFLGRQKQNKFYRLDTVLLEIVFSDHQEWYAASGDTDFSSPNPVEFITQGMIGNRIFGDRSFDFTQICSQSKALRASN